MEFIYLCTSIFFGAAFLVMCYLDFKKFEKIKRYKLMVGNYEERVVFMTKELSDIASLNKFCIERWEKAVLENQQLNKSNFQLIQLVNQKDKDI